MTVLTPQAPVLSAVGEDTPIEVSQSHTPADRAFRFALVAASATVLFLLAAITLFLIVKGLPAARAAKQNFFLSVVWNPDGHHFGVLPLLGGSVAIALVAIVIAAPLSMACALMINELAPKRMRGILTGTVDLLATIPSIVYGFWGLEIVSTSQAGVAQWLAHYFGFVPFFQTPSPGEFVKSVFATGLICSLTIVPIITSVSREVMAQAPRDACEAALGLGGTRWGMITDVLLPFSRNGIVGAILLGFGRGLGETMIVVLVLSSANHLTPGILGPNGLGSIAKEITEYFVTGSNIEKSALILAGLALFATTLAVNAVARAIVLRSEGVTR